MGGTSSQQQQTSQQSQLTPYAPAAAGLQGILSGLDPSISNINGTPQINQAYSQLEQNAQAPNPYAPALGAATLGQLGGGQNYGAATNLLTNNYNSVAGGLSPYTSGNPYDLTSNPALAAQLGTVNSDVMNSVNPMFSAAGRLGSPSNYQALARGITQGSAPILQNAASNQLNALGQLQGAGSNTASGLLGADVANAGIQSQGANNVPGAFLAPSMGAQQLLAAATGQQQQPIQTAGLLASILGPLAAQFGQQTGSGTQTGTNTMSGAQQFATLGQGFNAFMNPFRTTSGLSFPSMPS